MKKCSRCRIIKEKDEFGVDLSRWDRLQPSCRPCRSIVGSKRITIACVCGDLISVRASALRGRRHRGHSTSTAMCPSCIAKMKSEMSSKYVGDKNPNWKGGATSEANRFYNSLEWKALRRQAFERDNWTCRDCPQRGGRLEANHIKPRSRFPDLKLVLDNIETLCKKCHDKKKWMVYAPM